MARITGIDLPKNKRVVVALTYIFGIGKVTSSKVLKEAGVSGDVRVKDLSDKDVNLIRTIIEKVARTEGDLRKDVSLNIKRLMDIGSYRGMRHKRSLPVRGQRTRTNARIRKGPRKTVGSGKKPTGDK